MMNDNLLYLKKYSTNYKKNKKSKSRLVSSKNLNLLPSICLIIIILTAMFITRTKYICNNSKNLQFAVEYNLTTGFSSKNKLLRVQTMSLISSDEESAIIEAFGLSKSAPHKSTIIRASFKRDNDRTWYLDKILDS